MALARLGNGDEAAEVFHMLNPVNHARQASDAARYRLEPYVMAGDVYSHPDHRGRGGWSWYTGSAGWMYRAAVESLLGLRRTGATFAVDPCIPSAWPRVPDDLARGRDPIPHPRDQSRAALPRSDPGNARRRRWSTTGR